MQRCVQSKDCICYIHYIHVYIWAYRNGCLLPLSTIFFAEREHNRLEFLYPNHFYPGIRVSTIEEPLSERLDSVIVVLDVCMMCFGQLVTRGTNRVIFEQEYYLDIHILR